VICGEVELRLDDCVPCELPNSATSVRGQWEVPNSVSRVPDLDPPFMGTALHLRAYILPTHQQK